MICPAISLHFRVWQKDFSHTGGNAFRVRQVGEEKWKRNAISFSTEFWGTSGTHPIVVGTVFVENRKGRKLIVRQSAIGSSEIGVHMAFRVHITVRTAPGGMMCLAVNRRVVSSNPA
jgi:hypothetical protein